MNDKEKNELLVRNTENQELLIKYDKCDKYDYLIAVACGAIGGVIDVFLVGTPGDSVLGKWTDEQVDNAVKLFAKKSGWKPREGKENSVTSAIGFLEKKYKVNYDQRHSGDVNNLFEMSTKNHHMKSLAHSPDIIGLFFSVLNQFTSTSTFISNGQLITIETATYELRGHDFKSKLFCGVANWFGHLMSDIAGSSGAVTRGSGIVMPFYELFGLCDFGKFKIGEDRQSLAILATRAFQEGYDARFGMAMAIPVLLTNLLIRLIWSIRQHFQFKVKLTECIPIANRKNETLRVMLLVGNGTLCTVDAIDAGVRSGGNALAFFMRFNLVAWYKLVKMVLKEVCIRIGIGVDDFYEQVAAFRRINEAIKVYLAELEKIDIEAFKKETDKYIAFNERFEKISSEKELNSVLLTEYDILKMEFPWTGDFDEFMGNKSNRLVFD